MMAWVHARNAGIALIAATALLPSAGHAADDPSVDARVARLEAVNAALIDYIRATAHGPEAERLIARLSATGNAAPAATNATAPAAPAAAATPAGLATAPAADHYPVADNAGSASGGAPLFGLASAYGARMLSHTEWTNNKPLQILDARATGEVNARITFSGEAIVLGDWEYSNRSSKFDWTMRFPTNGNEVGNHVSELTVHSAALAFTAALTPGITSYVSMLYNPEQNFGAGTNTSVGRNTVTVDSAYVVFGDLKRLPFYAALGKIDVPFGLNDTVSPFSDSWNWHTFAGLANGAEVGFHSGGLNIRAMAIEGGAQFRAVNSSVAGTNVPSLVNNWSVDANYTAPFDHGAVMLGASYEHSSDYCDAYPAGHFNACAGINPAWAAYGSAHWRRLQVIADYARTVDVWPASGAPAIAPDGNPNPLSIYTASVVSARTIGARYNAPITTNGIDASFEFSSVHSGAPGSPWFRQNQWTLGFAHHFIPSVKVFAEAIHTQGYAPLAFMSGGNFPNGATWSDDTAISNVGVLGIEAGF